MPVDNCNLSFKELADRVLPEHMKRIRTAMERPFAMIDFGQRGIGIRTILERFNRSKDFSGCYVLIEHKKPIYVGISRTVIQRLMQHVKGTTHFDASLAYRIATEKYSHGLQREAAMKNPAFRKEFERAKEYISSLKAAFIEIENDIELYLFEAYCALELDTSQWNTFRTH